MIVTTAHSFEDAVSKKHHADGLLGKGEYSMFLYLNSKNIPETVALSDITEEGLVAWKHGNKTKPFAMPQNSFIDFEI